jgi:hypothetical protein
MTPHLRKCAPYSPPPPAEKNGLVRSSPTKFRLLRISVTGSSLFNLPLQRSLCAVLVLQHY